MKLSKTATAFTAIQLASAVAPAVASADTISDVVDKAHKAGLDVKVEKSTARATSQAEADRLNAEQAKQLEKDAQTISTKIDTYVKEKQDVESYNKTITTTSKTEGSVDAAKIQELKDQNAKIEKENADAHADYLKRLAEVRADNEKKQREYEEELARVRAENSEGDKAYQEELARVQAENAKRIKVYKEKLAEIRKEVAKATTTSSNDAAISEAHKTQLKTITSAIEENDKALAEYESQLADVETKNKAAADAYNKKKAEVDAANDKAQKDYEAAVARYEKDKAELDKRPVFAKNGTAEIRGQYNESARGSIDYFNQFGLLDPSYNGESLSEPITYKEGTSKIGDVQGMKTYTKGDRVGFQNITNGASFTVSNVSHTASGEVVNMKITVVDRGRPRHSNVNGNYRAELISSNGAFGWYIADGDRLALRYELYTASGKHLSVPTLNIISDIDYRQGVQFEFSGKKIITTTPPGSGVKDIGGGVFGDVEGMELSDFKSTPQGTMMAGGYGDITYTHYFRSNLISADDTTLKAEGDRDFANDPDSNYYYEIFGKSSLLKTAVPPKKPTPKGLPPVPELKVVPPQPKLKEIPPSPRDPGADEDPNEKPKKRPTLELLPDPVKPITDSTDPEPPTLTEEPKAPTPKSLNPIPKETTNTIELKKDPNKPELKLQSVEYVYTIKTIWETVDGHVLRPWKDGEQPKDSFNGYEYVRTVKDNDGNIHHIYKPIPKKTVTTIWVTEDGKVLRPRENGEQPKDNFNGYEYVRTEKDKDGNTTHIYRPIPKKPEPKKTVTTIWVTEDGKVLRPRENGEQPKDNFNGYEYVRTEKDKDGNTTHIYRPIPKKPEPKKNVTTIWVTEDGKVLRPRENGEQPKDNFNGYEYVRTEKDKDGNTTHIYRPIPKKNVTTIWVTEDGKVLRPRENGEQPKDNFDGYEYVRTDKDKDGNVTHVYKPIPKKNVTTIWVTEDGQVLRPRENGEQPKDNFDGYTYVRTEKDKDGNIRHIYKPVPKQPKEAPKAKELPKTGDASSLGLIGSLVSGLGLTGLRRKKRAPKRGRK